MKRRLVCMLILVLPGMAAASVPPDQLTGELYKYCGLVTIPEPNATPPANPTYRLLGPESLAKADPGLAEAIDQVSGFIQRGDHTRLRRTMSRRWRSRVTAQEIQTVFELVDHNFGKAERHELLEVHVADFPPQRIDAGLITLAPVPGRSLSLPSPVYVSSPIEGHTAVALYRRHSAVLPARMSLVMERSERGWHYATHCVDREVTGGETYRWYADRATEFEARGMPRNAFLYRTLAANLSLAPFIVSQWTDRFYGAVDQGEVPAGIHLPRRTPPGRWPLADGTVDVHFVSYLGTADSLMLDVRYASTIADLDSAAAEAERHQVAAYLCAHYPEYAYAFDGVLIGSTDPQGAGIRSYFRFEDGRCVDL